jgi:hypothetical protein
MERIFKLQESPRIDPDDRPHWSASETQKSGDGEREGNRSPKTVRKGIGNKLLSEAIGVPVSTIEKWKGAIKRGEPSEFRRYPNFEREWAIGTDGLWYRRESSDG